MNEETKKRRGRPVGSKIEKPASATLPRVRITPEKLNEYKEASVNNGLTFSDWIRQALDREVKRKR